MKILVYSTRKIQGREGQNIMNHFGLLKKYSEKIDFLSTNKTNKTDRIIHEATGLFCSSVFRFTEFYFECINKKGIKSWDEVYDLLDVSSLRNYEMLCIVGNVDLKTSNLGRIEKKANVFPYGKTSNQMHFVSTATVLINVLALLKAHNLYGIPLQEIIFDPFELSYWNFHEDFKPKFPSLFHSYHGYDIPRYGPPEGIKRLDSLQCLETKGLSFFVEEQEKDLDFVFGYTVLGNSKREYVGPFVQELIKGFRKNKLFVKSLTEDTTVPLSAYLGFVSRAKYTLILPSYDASCFSIYRFIESLQKDCLPLIHPYCNIKEVQDSFNFDLNILRINEDFSLNFTDKEREDVLEDVKKTFLVQEKLFL
jgi:hypothetical protein